VVFAADYQYALVTMSDNGKKKWITLCSEAMLELSHSMMAGRIIQFFNLCEHERLPVWVLG
jgi:hypothetical protein